MKHNYLQGLTGCVLALTLLGATRSLAVSFDRTDYATGSAPQAVATADFDGDGYPDLAVANCVSPGSFSVLLNNGDGTFASRTDYATGDNPCSIAVGDFNGDGFTDLVVGNLGFGVNTVSVLLNQQDGTFGNRMDFPAGSSPKAVVVADFNEDGIPDLAVVNGSSSSVSILIGYGNGAFGPPMPFTTASRPSSAVAGDFNNDGHLDLAVATGPSNISILLGNGNGTFGPKRDFTTGREPYSITTADFDGDGKLDLATANHFSSNVSVLLGNGDGTFRPRRDIATGASSEPFSVTTADFNFDGKPDLATANFSNNTVSILLGNGDGTFGGQSFFVGTHPVSVAAADFNLNGKPGVAAVNNGSNSVSVLLNTTP